jgi:tetratricopeptide (TPR) repeat protein
MADLVIKYSATGKVIAPQPIRLKIGDWAGPPEKMVDGSEPQPWHCLPFLEGSTYGLELVYQYETECQVVGADGTIRFDWDFAREPGQVVSGGEFVPFAPREASKYYLFNTGLDIQPPPGHVTRTEPHPRYFTDDSGTVPLAMIGHLQGEWYSRRLFVVFRGPRQGQRHLFRKGEPYAQLLFMPQKSNYAMTPFTAEEDAHRRKLESGIGTTKALIADNIWHDKAGMPFNNHYKILARAFAADGQTGVEQIIGDATRRQKDSYPSDFAQCLEQANQLLSQAKYNDAGAIYSHLLGRQPNNPDVLSRMAVVLWCNQVPMAAIKMMSQAAALQPQAQSHQVDLSQMLFRVGRFSEAEAALHGALQSSPRDPRLITLLGQILASQNRHEDSRACYQTALAIDPGNADAQRGISALPPQISRT